MSLLFTPWHYMSFSGVQFHMKLENCEQISILVALYLAHHITAAPIHLFQQTRS